MIIKNAHVINPADRLDGIYDILIKNEKIAQIDRDIRLSPGEEVIDAGGSFVFPGFVDLHAHFRDPGLTHKEDIHTGSRAAARGGFTTVCVMPNTVPVTDSVSTIEYVISEGKKAGLTNVLPIAAITEGMKGEKLNDIKALIQAGACAVSEDGKSVMNAEILRQAMVICKSLNKPVFSHCEDANLVRGGVINAGEMAERFSLPPITDAVEDVIAIRDILLAGETGVKLHLCHNSTKASADFIKYGRKMGYNVTGEVCPHHFTLKDSDIPGPEHAEYKMNPPLRNGDTVEVLRRGLGDGTYEVIATDHAPHAPEEKAIGFLKAPSGIVGLETAASLTYTELVLTGILSPMTMAERMSLAPAKILGIDKGDISVGKTADLVIFNPDIKYEIRQKDFVGKSHNMPYEGRAVQGVVTKTILSGKVVYETR